MKHILVIFLLLFSYQLFSNNIDIKKCIVRNDNTFVLYKDIESDTEKTPPVVLKRISNFIKELKVTKGLGFEFYVYKIKLEALNIELFSLISCYNQMNINYIFIYDKKRKIVYNESIGLNIKWGYNYDSGFDYKMLVNYFEIKEIDTVKNEAKLIFRERVHNGNLYNGIITHYYTFQKDKGFLKEFSIENLATCMDYKIERILFEDTINVYGHLENKIIHLGYAIIDRKNKRVVKKHEIEEGFKRLFITCSDESEDEFLNKGLTFYY
jgi:hypothetical protein